MIFGWPGGGVPFWEDWKIEEGSTLADWPVKLKLGVPDLLFPAELFPPLFVPVVGNPGLLTFPPKMFPLFTIPPMPWPLFIMPPKALGAEGKPTTLVAAGAGAGAEAPPKLNEGFCALPPKPLIAGLGTWFRDGKALLLMEKILPAVGGWYVVPPAAPFDALFDALFES